MTSHTYTNPGVYTAMLFVGGDGGPDDYDLDTVTITVADASNLAPTAVVSTSASSGTAPLDVAFDGSGTSDADGSVVSYAWDFGDGSTGSGAVVSHTYATAGSFTATLTVTDDDGATDAESVTVTVAAPPAPAGPVASVRGSGTLPGANGGTATVVFDVQKIGSLSTYSGRVKISDPAAGVFLDTPVVFAKVTRTGTNGATGKSSWVSFAKWPWRSYSLTWSVDDVGAVDVVSIKVTGRISYTLSGALTAGDIVVK